MRRASLSLLILTLGLGLVGLTFAQGDKTSASKDKDAEMKKEEGSKSEPRLRGQLPANYKKLGLSAEQTQKIYKIQAGYDQKLADLEEQLKKLKADERKEIDGVLTAAQKARLKEFLTEKVDK